MAVWYAALSACRKVHLCHCNSLGGATWRSVTTTRRTDRRTDRVRRNMRPPPREEGRIIRVSQKLGHAGGPLLGYGKPNHYKHAPPPNGLPCRIRSLLVMVKRYTMEIGRKYWLLASRPSRSGVTHKGSRQKYIKNRPPPRLSGFGHTPPPSVWMSSALT